MNELRECSAVVVIRVAVAAVPAFWVAVAGAAVAAVKSEATTGRDPSELDQHHTHSTDLNKKMKYATRTIYKQGQNHLT
jgi:hypothetical protein